LKEKMSWKAAGWVKCLRCFPDGGKMDPREKFLLLIVADYYNEEKGYAWASASRLAADTLSSERWVRYTLKKLADVGLIGILAPKTKGYFVEGKWISESNRYTLPLLGEEVGQGVPHVENVSEKTLSGKDDLPLLGGGGAQRAGGGTAPDAGVGAPHAGGGGVNSEGVGHTGVPDKPISLSRNIKNEDVVRASAPADAPADWGPKDDWIRKFILEQEYVEIPNQHFLDHAWWARAATHCCNGVSEPFLIRVFAALGNHFVKYPTRRPTIKRGWLQKMENFLRKEREIINREDARKERERNFGHANQRASGR
jgi:Helix-turn-helix domain